MIKLKRINEGQLDLFSRRPKELDPPKPQVKKEPKSYDGMMDTDQSKWFTQSFLNKKYDEYKIIANFDGIVTKLDMQV